MFAYEEQFFIVDIFIVFYLILIDTGSFSFVSHTCDMLRYAQIFDLALTY